MEKTAHEIIAEAVGAFPGELIVDDLMSIKGGCVIAAVEVALAEGRRRGLGEAANTVSDAIEAYDYGDRPQSPPAALLKLDDRIRKLMERRT